MGGVIFKNYPTRPKTIENSLIHYLEQIPDYCKSGGIRHPLPIALPIVIMAIMKRPNPFQGGQGGASVKSIFYLIATSYLT